MPCTARPASPPPARSRWRGSNGKKQTLETKAVAIASGSEVANLPGITIDEKRIISSTGALSLASVPKRLVVIGAGYIGLELGSVWSRLGAEVTVVEMLDRVAPGLDAEVAKQLQRVLTKQGLAFKLGVKVAGVDAKGKSLKLTLEPAKGGKPETLECDVVLVAVGRVPNTQGLGLAEAGVKTDNRGRIIVDEKFATSVPGIYAIGDVIKGPMLAHKAEDEGIALAEILAGQAGHVNYDVIPSVIYTAPEVASVGKTEEELKQAGIAYRSGKFPFTANGRAKVNRTTEGFVKILAEEDERPRARRAYHRRRCRHHDRRSRRADGVRRLGGGPRAHLPRPSDAERSDQGSGARRRQARDPHVSGNVSADCAACQPAPRQRARRTRSARRRR